MPWTRWSWRLANGSVGLTFALLAGCSDSSPPPFELLRVEPAIVRNSVETPAVVKGTQFYNSVKVRLNDGEPSNIDRGWDVWVDEIQLRRDQTSRRDDTSLAIVLPAGLTIGIHDLSVTDPRGQSRTLSDALTVVADSNTTVPNATGGATSIGSGGTPSRSDGGNSGNTLLSSGGTEATGGTASSTIGGTEATGGTASSTIGGTEATGGTASAAGSGNSSSTNGGTETIGGSTSIAGSSNTIASSGGTEATGDITGTAGTGNASTTSGGTGASPKCGNGKCEPTEGFCNCPSDCQPPSCGDAGSPQLCDVNDPSLVACYRFESSAQPGKDDSRYGNHATSTNTTLVSGHDGNSISLGASSRVHVAKSPSLDTPHVTIEMWIRLGAVPAGTRAGLYDNDGQYGIFMLKSGALWCSRTTPVDDNAAQTTSVVSLLVWTHVACTYDGANIKIFINGVEQASAPATGALSTSGTTGASIGSNSPTGDNLVGLLDDLRVWNIARTADQICEAAHACML